MIKVNTDKDGYLLDLTDWQPEIAEWLAQQEGINLTPLHWAVINELREFYFRYKLLPTMRLLLSLLQKKLGAYCPQSSQLQLLFPGGLFRQASKIAGLPKPLRCI